ILLFRSPKDAAGWSGSAPFLHGRDRFGVVLTSGAPVASAVFHDATQLLLGSSVARMPEHIERGLTDLFSTVQVTGILIKLGTPPAERSPDWALVHLLAVDPEYYGKLRVLLYNLRNGVAEDAAYRNAIGKTAGEIEKQAATYLAAGNFQTVNLSPRPINVEHDFPEFPVEPAALRLALADLLLPKTSAAAYEALLRDHLFPAEAHEGLGLLALRAKESEAARGHFASAMEAGSQSPMAYVEYARLETDHAKVLAALQKAVQLNPKLAEPHFLLARQETDADKRVAEFQLAASLAVRNTLYWQSLAEACLDQHKFGEAAKAWRAAEQAADNRADRDRFHRARMAIEQQRLDYEAAERRRAAEEKERELNRLKEQARAELRALEAKANQGQSPATGEKVVPWWEGEKPAGKATGALKQIDCLGRQARLVIQTDNQKTIRLLIPDPSQIAILGGGEHVLGCGPQKDRRISVEYFPKPNTKLATAGEAATIEFQ
ncbi:MAG TPA: hypothetical protein VG672_28470, partial [Bryobacteraceae bacterium]|nr:hypothetical protein [Bryobacteraceae bacterium]